MVRGSDYGCNKAPSPQLLQVPKKPAFWPWVSRLLERVYQLFVDKNNVHFEELHLSFSKA